MSILSKLGIVKSNPKTITLNTLLNFMNYKWNELVPESDYYRLVEPIHESAFLPSYSGYSYRYKYVLNNKYLIIFTANSFITSDTSKYTGNETCEIEIYLIDNTFNAEKYFDSYSYIECFPKIIDYNSYNSQIIEGPWIDDLKSYIKSIKVGSKYLEHKARIDEAERERELKWEREKQCCNKKRDNILNNYGK
jgi:hypothetical protein